MEPKPFKAIDDQISILRERGMEIHNAEFARSVLREIGYYPCRDTPFRIELFGAGRMLHLMTSFREPLSKK